MAEKRYRRVTPWPLVFVFVLLASAIGAAGREYYRNRTHRSRREIQKPGLDREPQDRADLEWRRERLDDAAEVGVEAEGRRAGILELLARPGPQVRAALLGWLEEVQAPPSVSRRRVSSGRRGTWCWRRARRRWSRRRRGW